MKTIWKGELYRHDELYDTDFPERDTVLEAIEDAELRLGCLTEGERRGITGAICEWEIDGLPNGEHEYKSNTGRYYDQDQFDEVRNVILGRV